MISILEWIAGALFRVFVSRWLDKRAGVNDEQVEVAERQTDIANSPDASVDGVVDWLQSGNAGHDMR
jgi:hypothetical protein